MKAIICTACGSREFEEQNGTRICRYCGTVYKTLKKSQSSTIALDDDISRLLQKCKNDPKNAKRYANLILDIDPLNKEAHKYL